LEYSYSLGAISTLVEGTEPRKSNAWLMEVLPPNEGGGLKSLTLLANLILDDIGNRVGISTLFDKKTVEERVKSEGDSFLTISLAKFAKDFERSLDRGFVDHDLFKGFSFKGSLPRFLGGFFDLIFDRGTGVLLSKPSIDSIYSIRQFSGMWSKIERDCTPERIAAAFDDYYESEAAVKLADKNLTPQEIEDFERICRLIYSGLFTDLDRKIYNGEAVPKHGPGSTADNTLGNKKYYWSTWTERLEFLFPAREFLSSSYSLSSEHGLHWLTPGQEPPVKVITVPKTMKTPRLIAKEPVHMQYVQQALLEMIVDGFQRDDILRKFVSFEDQEPNRYLAHEGSVDNTALATLDLSAASDRVSNQLVIRMTSLWPSLQEGLQACRSRSADVNGSVIRLAKYASMGSALCFPVEAMVFLALIFLGIEKKLGHRLTIKDVKSLDGQVRVFGDDMIVPVDCVQEVITTLEGFGLSVNRDKSFWTGKFRESCGKEYYSGYDVSIVKLRSDIPTRPTHVQEIVSLSAFRNQAQNLDLHSTVETLDRWISKLIPYPFVLETSPVVGRVPLDGIYDVTHWDSKLFRPLVRGVKVDARLPIDRLDSGPALLKFFLKRGILPSEEGHLERAGRPSTVRLKAGRYQPY